MSGEVNDALNSLIGRSSHLNHLTHGYTVEGCNLLKVSWLVCCFTTLSTAMVMSSWST